MTGLCCYDLYTPGTLRGSAMFSAKNEDFDDVAVRDVSLGEARLQGLPLDLD